MNWRTARRIVCTCTIAPQAAASANADVDPAAVKKLEKMGGYLRTLKAFQVQSVTSRDSVLVGGTVDMLVQRRPDRLRAEVTSDLRKSIRSPTPPPNLGTFGKHQFSAGLSRQTGSADDVALRNLLNGEGVHSRIDVRTTGFIHSLAHQF